MTLQAFFDESFDQNGCYVIAGCVASDDIWLAFSKEWNQLLPQYGISYKDGFSFKMNHMAYFLKNGQSERIEAFYRCIERHVLGFISCKIDAKELERAKSRIRIMDKVIEWHKFGAHMICYRYLIDKFHLARPDMTDAITLTEKVDFYFDQHANKNAINSSWSKYLSNRTQSVINFYGDMPKFFDDKNYPPLQAADFWAWWVRKWYSEGTPGNLTKRNFGAFQKSSCRKVLNVNIVVNEEDLVENLIRIAHNQVGENAFTYDIKDIKSCPLSCSFYPSTNLSLSFKPVETD